MTNIEQYATCEADFVLEAVYKFWFMLECCFSSDWLRAGRSGDGIQVGARFSAPVQTGRGAIQPPVQWVLGLSWG